ncbi:hypothetical protein BC833DRAFT_624557 [Globomyces pollinis-pini]|nr:hypothetical protein BC833DRAFT_624557 [Globomyces pollinis-pini]
MERQYSALVARSPVEKSNQYLYTLPTEILLEIASHLSPLQYHSLRFASKFFSLPSIATLTTEAYFQFLNEHTLTPALYYSKLLKLKSHSVYSNLPLFVTNSQYLLLIKYKHEQECIRQLSRNNYLLTKKTKQTSFELSFQSNIMPSLPIYLLKDGDIDPSTNNNLAIQTACQQGYYYLTKYLLTHPGVDPSINHNICIRYACKFGFLKILNLLLNHHLTNPAVSNNEAIRIASSRGHFEIVKRLLLDDRVDPSDLENEALQNAASRGYDDIVALLLNDPRVDPSMEDHYAIRIACLHGHFSVVKRLLEDRRVNSTAFGYVEEWLTKNSPNSYFWLPK